MSKPVLAHRTIKVASHKALTEAKGYVYARDLVKRVRELTLRNNVDTIHISLQLSRLVEEGKILVTKDSKCTKMYKCNSWELGKYAKLIGE